MGYYNPVYDLRQAGLNIWLPREVLTFLPLREERSIDELRGNNRLPKNLLYSLDQGSKLA